MDAINFCPSFQAQKLTVKKEINPLPELKAGVSGPLI
jgi:hypothetical protein